MKFKVYHSNNQEILESFFIPIELLESFFPYNVEFFYPKTNSKLYLSLCIEKKDLENNLDPIAQLQVKNVMFDPFPMTKKIFITLHMNSYVPEILSLTFLTKIFIEQILPVQLL